MAQIDGVKMKTFITTQENCAWLGISWHQSLQKYLFNFKNLFALFILTFCAVLNCLYFCYDATTFNEYAISAYTTLTAIVSVITFLITILQMRAQFILIHDIEMILNKRLEHPTAREMYKNVVALAEKWSKTLVSIAMNVLFQGLMIPKFLVCYLLYYTTDAGNDIFELPFPYWYPFEWKNPVGYLVAYIIQYIGIGVMSFFVACCASAGVGFAVFVMLFTKDIKVNLKTVNKKAKSKGDHTQLLMDFCDVIEMHALTKKLVGNSAKLMQPIFVVVFTWSIIVLTVSMLIMRKAIFQNVGNDIDFMELLIPAFDFFWAFVIVFASCEICECMSDEFEQIFNIYDQFRWYRFSMKMQKILLTVFTNAQQSVHFECFGSIPSDRQTFKSVTNCAYQYFMVLVQFDN